MQQHVFSGLKVGCLTAALVCLVPSAAVYILWDVPNNPGPIGAGPFFVPVAMFFAAAGLGIGTVVGIIRAVILHTRTPHPDLSEPEK